jgi:hypothetical protein
MSHRAMHLINRDESRHIAVDFHMTEVFTSDEYLAATKLPGPLGLARGVASLATMMWHARPFLIEVFVRPMDRTDPSGRRIREAFKRIQLVMRKPSVARTPFMRFMIAAQDLYNRPVLGKVFGRVLLRALGAEERAARYQYTAEELARSQRMSFDELAEDALQAKMS